MTEIEPKFSFPLFCEPSSTVNLGKNEKLIISDIWAFWDYVVKKSSKNAKERRFMASLLEQAKHFYLSAESSPVKSQPLLYYYSFLNFAKILLTLKDKSLIAKKFHHGVKEENNHKFFQSELKLKQVGEQNINIAPRLIAHLECGVLDLPHSFRVKELLRHCVGVHRAYCEIYNEQEIFVRLQNGKVLKHGRKLVWRAELSSQNQTDLDTLKLHGYQIVKDEEDQKRFWEENVSMEGYNPRRADYAALSKKLRQKGLWYFIGNIGHTLYLSKGSSDRLSQESIIYLVMFYLGSITRYHPYLFEEIFSDKEQWLMSEFLSTQPKQFLYLATSRILGQSVLKAYASF